MTDSPMTPEARAAIEELLGDARTGDADDDLVAAARRSMEVRQRNSINGGAVLAALYARGWSWRDIERATGINTRTARRWAEPPPDDIQE